MARSARSPRVSKMMNSENLLILVLVVVLLVLVVMFVRNNQENFRQRRRLVLYVFVVEWCPHCTRAKPQVAELQNNLSANNNQVNNVPVEVNLVDADENKELARSYNVNAYPTCVLERSDGTRVPFNNNVTADNLMAFLKENCN